MCFVVCGVNLSVIFPPYRISSLKGMTRTLEALLAESDAKFLS